MKRIRVYGTSANLGPGFDTLGIALNIYNEYRFAASNEFKLDGFDARYNNPDNNLIIKAYKETFNYLGKSIIPIYLKQEINEIPTSRGLGSSAACIVAGIEIANNILEANLAKEEILKIATLLEGHPDNVAPAIYGGLVISSKEEDKVLAKKVNISENLIFTLAIPSFEFSTEIARSVLPKEVKIEDAIYNISHAMLLLTCLEEGDISLIKEAIKEKLHVDYRISYIDGAKELLASIKDLDMAGTISGAGSTMLLISKKSYMNELKELLPSYWLIKETKCQKEGVIIYEE